jgi:putative transposase
MPRRTRFATGGYVFHVLNRAVARHTIFATDTDYDAMQRTIEQARHEVPMRVLCYIVMPNHWHLILWPDEDHHLSSYMQWLTLTHTQRWHKAHDSVGSGPIYQGRFKSFAVETDDHLLRVCRYVERNALRANLVRSAENWRWKQLMAVSKRLL